MPSRDPRVDAYIEKAAPFAQPILRHVRAVVHAACPEVEETVKWSFPHFEHKGILCSMAAFKEHCTIAFWNPEEVVGVEAKAGAMGEFGRITSLEALPSDEALAGYVAKAVALREAGVKAKRTGRPAKPEVEVPDDLARALSASPEVSATFDGFSPSHRREYVEWIVEAKREATRERRIARAVEWMSEGKPRNWKYM